VVVHDLDIFSTAVFPQKADSELIVHANAVLSGAIASQDLQPVARRHAKIVESCRAVQDAQLASCNGLNVDESRHALSIEQSFRLSAPERLDHSSY